MCMLSPATAARSLLPVGTYCCWAGAVHTGPVRSRQMQRLPETLCPGRSNNNNTLHVQNSSKHNQLFLLCWRYGLGQRPKRQQSKNNWRAPWKNRISSTTMKLRKSLVKPVTRQNISSCLVLPPEIVMHDTFNVILWTSADILDCYRVITTFKDVRLYLDSLYLKIYFVDHCKYIFSSF